MKGAIPLVNSEKRKQLIIDTCILAGKIMLESGSEVYRTEDTITRIAANAGEPESVCYTTATGIFVGFRSSNYTQLENIPQRSINLEKVSLVNQLSREFAQKEITLPELYQRLTLLETDTPTFSISLCLLAAGIVSCTLMYIFGGTWQDFIATFFCWRDWVCQLSFYPKVIPSSLPRFIRSRFCHWFVGLFGCAFSLSGQHR